MGQCYEREQVETSKSSVVKERRQVELKIQLEQKTQEYEKKKNYQVEGEAPEEQLVSYAANLRVLDSVRLI